MAKKNAKHYPVLRKFPLTVANNMMIDSSRLLSQVNRRMYRASRTYDLTVSLNPQSTDDQITVYVLRDDWDLHGAVKLAYQAYRENTKDERDQTILEARWEDFRIDHGTTHTLVSPIITGINAGGVLGTDVTITAGEFPISAVTDQNGVTKTFKISGAGSASEYNILSEWDSAGNVQAEPSTGTTTGGAYVDLNTNVDVATMQRLQGDGNNPPYDKESSLPLYPWVKVASLGFNAQGVQQLSSGVIRAPLGFVAITSVGSGNGSVYVNYRSGDYKGVHSTSMTE